MYIYIYIYNTTEVAWNVFDLIVVLAGVAPGRD